MSGFIEAIHKEVPKKGHRSVRMLWNAIKHTTGTPPSLIHYRPAGRYYEGEWQGRSSWVIHHETGTFTFNGPAQEITDVIRSDGLIQQEESV